MKTVGGDHSEHNMLVGGGKGELKGIMCGIKLSESKGCSFS